MDEIKSTRSRGRALCVSLCEASEVGDVLENSASQLPARGDGTRRIPPASFPVYILAMPAVPSFACVYYLGEMQLPIRANAIARGLPLF